MSDKDEVRLRYPEAYALEAADGLWDIIDPEFGAINWGDSEAEAWENAATFSFLEDEAQAA